MILSVHSLSAQKEDFNWVLVNHLKLDFNLQPPLVTADIPVIAGTAANSTSISDSIGNLLFYINGRYLYNFAHQLIFTAPAGGFRNSITVFPHPSEKNKYFWIVSVFGTTLPAKFNLYTIDMGANGGLGAVFLLDTIDNTDFAIARQVSSSNYWYVGVYIDKIIVYPLTSSGFGVGTTYNIAIGELVNGCKISPDMSKLYLNSSGGLSVIDFNCKTGELRNLRKIYTNLNINNEFIFYEFSRNNEYVYIAKQKSDTYEFTISQFLANATGNETEFLNSEKNLYQNVLDYQFGLKDIQLAPNNNIYISISDYYLWAIENPDLPAPLCTVNDKAIWLNGVKSGAYLPNYFYYFPTFGYLSSCLLIDFYYSGVPALNLLWNFGDSQTSATPNPTHLYANAGSYTVTLTVTYSAG